MAGLELRRGSLKTIAVFVVEKDEVKNRLTQEGFDGALVGGLAAIVRTETDRAPQTYVVGSAPFGTDPTGGPFDLYDQNAYSYAYDPGYRREDARYVVETVRYTLPEGKPIWKATSESVNPNSSNERVVEITRLVEKELQTEKRVGTPYSSPDLRRHRSKPQAHV